MTARNGGRSSVAALKSRLETHEAVCAERYGEIKESLTAIKSFLARATVGLVSGLFVMLGVILFEIAKSKGLL